MARTGEVSGFYFDKEVFTDYMAEQEFVNPGIIASGILQNDIAITNAIGAKGNVGTIPFFAPLDGTDNALNDDGNANNTPIELTGKKQSFMAISRMRAWKEKDYTRYLTGVSPLQHLADNLVDPYYKIEWQKVLLSIIKGAMGVVGLENHKTDISITTGSIADGNKINETSFIDLGQKALGQGASRFSLIFMHSAPFARLQGLKLINYDKYTIGDAVLKEITLPTYNGKIVIQDDSLVDTSVAGFPIYTSYMVGKGAILESPKEVPNPYYENFDPETNGGVNKIYTKQAHIYHPNGLSIAFDKIAAESPTNAELATAGNWSLAFNEKNVAISMIKSNG